MTHRQIARVLGLAKWQVQVIEFRALVKVAQALGLSVRPEPGWMRKAWPTRQKRTQACSRCGRLGHYRPTCAGDGT